MADTARQLYKVTAEEVYSYVDYLLDLTWPNKIDQAQRSTIVLLGPSQHTQNFEPMLV